MLGISFPIVVSELLQYEGKNCRSIFVGEKIGLRNEYIIMCVSCNTCCEVSLIKLKNRVYLHVCRRNKIL
jgi:hypothetical protein